MPQEQKPTFLRDLKVDVGADDEEDGAPPVPLDAATSTPSDCTARQALSSSLGPKKNSLVEGSTIISPQPNPSAVSSVEIIALNPSGAIPWSPSGSISALEESGTFVAESDLGHQEDPSSPANVDNKWFRAAETLPFLLAGPYKFFFLSLLEPTDPFPMVMRKLMITASFLWTPFPLGMALYWFIVGVGDRFSTGLTCGVGGAAGLALVSFVPSYLLVRCAKQANDWVVDWWVLTMYVFFTLIAVGVGQFPSSYAAFAITEASVLASQPFSHQWLHLLVSLFAFMLPSYNLNIAHTSWMQFQPSDKYLPPPGEAAILAFFGYVILLFMFLALLIMGMEFKSTLRQAEAGLAMIAEVGANLKTYDTDAVEETLMVCEEERLVALSLVRLFKGINSNLKAYRPHLPNWLMHELNKDDEEEGGKRLGDSNRSRLEDDEGSAPDYGASESFSLSGSGNKKPSFVQKRSTNSLPALTRSRSRPDSATNGGSGVQASDGPPLLSPTSSIGSLRSLTTPSQRPGNAAPKAASGIYDGDITMLQMDFLVLDSNQTDATALVVDLVHSVAERTKASIHSFVGDRLLASWNATNRVIAGQRKAVSFLAAFSKEIPGLQLSAAVASGRARCQFSGTKTRALTVELPWREELKLLSEYAAIHRAFVVCSRVVAETNTHFNFRAVDAVKVRDWRVGGPSVLPALTPPPGVTPPPVSRKTVKIFEFVGERGGGTEDDEWMYSLEASKQQKGNPDEAVTKALQLAITGEYGGAICVLEELNGPATEVYNRRTVVALLNKCEECLRAASEGAPANADSLDILFLSPSFLQKQIFA